MKKAFDKIMAEFDSLNNEEYCQLLYGKVDILLNLLNTLYEDKIDLPSDKAWIEGLIKKFSFHITSILKLYEGTVLVRLKNDTIINIIDEPSIFVLFRASLESYLTFFYLFVDNEVPKVLEFRMIVWRYSGLKQRTEFDITSDENKLKQFQESNDVEILKEIIINSPIYKGYNSTQRKQIIDGKNPRLFNSWNKLIKKSELRNATYKNIYGFKSSYTHSEFLSVLQIQSGNFVYRNDSHRSRHWLFIIHTLLSKTIIELTLAFPTIKKHYDELKQTIKTEIEILKICSTNT
jgi:hypothetical protein